MFAILKTGGKQYKVAKEEKLLIEKIDGNIGDEVVFNDIITVSYTHLTLPTIRSV